MKQENEIAKKIDGVSGLMAQKYNMDSDNFIKTFKASLFKSLKREPTNEEVGMMMIVAHEYDLNPFVGQIYAFPAKNGGIVPVVGIDGFSTIAERNKDYDGFEIAFAPTNFTMMKKDKNGADTSVAESKPCPEYCEIRVFRKNLTHPIVVREYLDEVYCSPRNGFDGAWQSHTKRMLRHKTIIQGFRLAFSITGIYDEDEARRIIDVQGVDVTGKPDVEMPKALPETSATPAPEAQTTSTTEQPKETAKEPPKEQTPPPQQPPEERDAEGMTQSDRDAMKKLDEEPEPQTPEQFRSAIAKLLIEMNEGNTDDAKAMLKAISSFETDEKVNGVKTGKRVMVEGKTETSKLSDKQCQVIYGKVKKQYDQFKGYAK